MAEMDNNILFVQVDKEVTALFKEFLELVEDRQRDHNIMIDKLKKIVDPEFVEAVDNLTKEKQDQIRKRVLDKGNECKRQIHLLLGLFDFALNKEAVAKLAANKRIVKKVVSGGVISYNKETKE